MSKEGLLKICKESIEKVKNGNMSLDNFCKVYEIYLEQKDKEEEKISKDYEENKERIIYYDILSTL